MTSGRTLVSGSILNNTNISAGVMSTNAVNVATTAGAKDKAAGGAGAQFFLGGILVFSWVFP